MSRQKHTPDFLTMLLRSMQSDTIDSIAGPYIGEISKLDKDKGVADIQPQGKLDKEKQPLVHDVNFLILPMYYGFETVGYGSPSQYSLKKPMLDYQVGDQVICITLKHDNSNYDIESPKLFEIETERKHSIDFSFVVARIAKKKDFKK